MSDETAWITAQVPADLKQGIDAIAERDDRSVSWVVRHALKNHVANFGVADAERKAPA